MAPGTPAIRPLLNDVSPYTSPMTATYASRVKRLRRLEALLPAATAAPADCPDGARLLQILGDDYGSGDSPARRRALQRDLVDLLKEGRIAAVNPGGKPLRYRRLGDDVTEDPLIWQYTLEQIRDLVAEAVPERRLDRLWERLLHEIEGPLLDAQRLRCVPDTLRLRPVELYPDVLTAVIQALAQRGPIPYLLALKNDEVAPVRFYALHRMIRAQIQMYRVET